MCGRFVSRQTPAELAAVYDTTRGPEVELEADYNVAPTDPVYAVLERTRGEDPEPARELAVARWGLVPPWTKALKGAKPLFNARVETAHEKPSFAKAFRTRRAIVPATGYYEWLTATDKSKQPFYLHPAADGDLLHMAALYGYWRNPEFPDDHPEAWLMSVTILTTDATDGLGVIHDRTPMTVPQQAWDEWLHPAEGDPGALRSLLLPATALVEAYPVSTAVNSVRNNTSDLITPTGR